MPRYLGLGYRQFSFVTSQTTDIVEVKVDFKPKTKSINKINIFRYKYTAVLNHPYNKLL